MRLMAEVSGGFVLDYVSRRACASWNIYRVEDILRGLETQVPRLGLHSELRVLERNKLFLY